MDAYDEREECGVVGIGVAGDGEVVGAGEVGHEDEDEDEDHIHSQTHAGKADGTPRNGSKEVVVVLAALARIEAA